MQLNMPFNDVKTDLYIGTSCGKMVMDAIDVATKRIMILSPYVDSEYLDKLAGKASNGVYVKVVTCYEEESSKAQWKGRSKSILNQVSQHRSVDDEKKQHQVWAGRFLLALGILLLLTGVALVDSFRTLWNSLTLLSETLTVEALLTSRGAVLWGVLFFELVAMAGLFLFLKRNKVFRYQYGQKYDFQLFLNPHKNRGADLLYMHSKIYLIDDVAFVGSLNFTKSGFIYNMETRCKLSDPAALRYLEQVFAEIARKPVFGDMNRLVRRHFHEKPN